MQIGMIGLGRMGTNMVRRLLKGGHQCVVYNRSPQAVEALVEEGADGASSLSDLVQKMEKPLDDQGSHRRGRSGAGAQHGAVLALQFTR